MRKEDCRDKHVTLIRLSLFRKLHKRGISLMSKMAIESVTLDYECIGNGTPVLFLHGWGLDKRVLKGCFEPIFQRLKGFQRIYVDLPGMGSSTAGTVKCSEDILPILHQFVQAITKQAVILVGESYGGYLARGFIHEYRELTQGIILLCPLMVPGYRQGRVEPYQLIEQDDTFLKTLTKEEYESFSYMNVRLTKDVWERYRKEIMPAIKLQDQKFLGEVLEGACSFDVDELDTSYDEPCLILVGRQDTEVGYTDQLGLLRKYINATYCVIPNAGHNLQIEQPEKFEAIVKPWFVEIATRKKPRIRENMNSQELSEIELVNRLYLLHTTELGSARIKKNLALEVEDVVEWCRMRILLPKAIIRREGKNWYVESGDCILTINANNYCIITAHKNKKK